MKQIKMCLGFTRERCGQPEAGSHRVSLHLLVHTRVLAQVHDHHAGVLAQVHSHHAGVLAQVHGLHAGVYFLRYMVIKREYLLR